MLFSGDGVFHNMSLVGSFLLLCLPLGKWECSSHHEHNGEVSCHSPLTCKSSSSWSFGWYLSTMNHCHSLYPTGDPCFPKKTTTMWSPTTSARSKRALASSQFSTRYRAACLHLHLFLLSLFRSRSLVIWFETTLYLVSGDELLYNFYWICLVYYCINMDLGIHILCKVEGR